MASPDQCYSKASAPVGKFGLQFSLPLMPNERSREGEQKRKVFMQDCDNPTGSYVQECVRKVEDKMVSRRKTRKMPSAPVDERDKSASSASSPTAVSSSHANWLQHTSFHRKLLEELGVEAYLRDVVRKMKGFSQSSTPDKMDEREQLSIDKVETSSKKIKKSQEGISRTNTRMVYKEEKLSIMRERYETSLLEPAAMICQPCTFRPGQSILQWWAEWMKDCDTLGSAPKSYNNRKGTKFKRPAWFSGEVAAGPFEDSIVYAGVPYKGECFQVY